MEYAEIKEKLEKILAILPGERLTASDYEGTIATARKDLTAVVKDIETTLTTDISKKIEEVNKEHGLKYHGSTSGWHSVAWFGKTAEGWEMLIEDTTVEMLVSAGIDLSDVDEAISKIDQHPYGVFTIDLKHPLKGANTSKITLEFDGVDECDGHEIAIKNAVYGDQYYAHGMPTYTVNAPIQEELQDVPSEFKKIKSGFKGNITNIPINEEHFPDKNFRDFVNERYGTNGVLKADTIAKTTWIDCSYRDIKDLTGIEYFTAIDNLDCRDNALTTLDVNNNTVLKGLYCSDNNLTALDVSNNTELEELECSDNDLETLDVSKNTALEYLNCSANNLTTLDVSKNTALEKLCCINNALTALDVSNNTELEELECSDNDLETLDVSHNILLEELACSENHLTTLDVSNNTALKELYCWKNDFVTLNVSNNTALKNLGCDKSVKVVRDNPYLEESPDDRIDRITKQHAKEAADNPLSPEDRGKDQDTQIK